MCQVTDHARSAEAGSREPQARCLWTVTQQIDRRGRQDKRMTSSPTFLAPLVQGHRSGCSVDKRRYRQGHCMRARLHGAVSSIRQTFGRITDPGRVCKRSGPFEQDFSTRTVAPRRHTEQFVAGARTGKLQSLRASENQRLSKYNDSFPAQPGQTRPVKAIRPLEPEPRAFFRCVRG